MESPLLIHLANLAEANLWIYTMLFNKFNVMFEFTSKMKKDWFFEMKLEYVQLVSLKSYAGRMRHVKMIHPQHTNNRRAVWHKNTCLFINNKLDILLCVKYSCQEHFPLPPNSHLSSPRLSIYSSIHPYCEWVHTHAHAHTRTHTHLMLMYRQSKAC